MKRRYSSVDQLAREARRGSIVGSGGINKYRDARRRRSMGVFGERVVIPGSPAITLPELLQQAERRVEMESPGKGKGKGELWTPPVRNRDPFVTPLPARIFAAPVSAPAADGGVRVWTKEEWKLLDSCFTDERMELVEANPGVYAGRGEMAPVEDVVLASVVERFVRMVGGEGVVGGYGDAWSRYGFLLHFPF